MTKNDKKLLGQMIEAGRFSWDIYAVLCQQNAIKSKAIIKAMGNKWVCHKDNQVKRLEIPLDLLNAHRGSKILNHFQSSKFNILNSSEPALAKGRKGG